MYKYIVVVDYYFSWVFFSRLLSSCQVENVVFVTNLPSVYFEAKKLGFNCLIASKKAGSDKNIDVSRAREYLSGDIIRAIAEDYCATSYGKLDDVICESCTPKGLYKKARDREISSFTGIDSQYETTGRAEVVMGVSAMAVEEIVQSLKALYRNYVSNIRLVM